MAREAQSRVSFPIKSDTLRARNLIDKQEAS